MNLTGSTSAYHIRCRDSPLYRRIVEAMGWARSSASYLSNEIGFPRIMTAADLSGKRYNCAANSESVNSEDRIPSKIPTCKRTQYSGGFPTFPSSPRDITVIQVSPSPPGWPRDSPNVISRPAQKEDAQNQIFMRKFRKLPDRFSVFIYDWALSCRPFSSILKRLRVFPILL